MINERIKFYAEEAIDNAKFYWKEYIKIPSKDFVRGIKNIIRWMPIVWRDRDWDNHYIMEPILFKLKSHIQYVRDHGHTVDENREKQIRTMTECLELLTKVHEDNYDEPYREKHNEKWGKSDYYTVPCEDRPDCHRLMDRNDEQYTPAQLTKKNKEYVMGMKIAHLNRSKDFALAMEIFVKEYDSWWD